MPFFLRYDATQGPTAEVLLPRFNGSSTQSWTFTVSFVCRSFDNNPVIVGDVGTGSRRLYIQTNGLLVWSGINTFSNIPLNTRVWLRIQNNPDQSAELSLSLDGVSFTGIGFTDTTSAMGWNRLGGAGGVLTPNFDFYSVVTTGSTYSDSFTTDTATGTGTSWLSLSGSRSITLSNFAGSVDSWWVSLGGAAVLSTLKRWAGTVWESKPLKYWNGSEWVQKTMKYWNGSTWVAK